MKIGQRMFPGKEKRKVMANIVTFHNVCPDAHHYYVDMYEELNPVWTGKGWRHSSDDEKGKGKTFIRESFHNYKSAERHCKVMFKKHFKKKTHVLVIEILE